MAEIARRAVNAVDFPGVMTNVDPRDLPDGAAAEQVNACSLRFGELAVRQGLKTVTFEEEET